MDITEFLIETADQCAIIAKTGRMLVEQLKLGSRNQNAGAFVATFRRGPEPVRTSRSNCSIAFGKSRRGRSRTTKEGDPFGLRSPAAIGPDGHRRIPISCPHSRHRIGFPKPSPVLSLRLEAGFLDHPPPLLRIFDDKFAEFRRKFAKGSTPNVVSCPLNPGSERAAFTSLLRVAMI